MAEDVGCTLHLRPGLTGLRTRAHPRPPSAGSRAAAGPAAPCASGPLGPKRWLLPRSGLLPLHPRHVPPSPEQNCHTQQGPMSTAGSRTAVQEKNFQDRSVSSMKGFTRNESLSSTSGSQVRCIYGPRGVFRMGDLGVCPPGDRVTVQTISGVWG